jgi:hypothetical protein
MLQILGFWRELWNAAARLQCALENKCSQSTVPYRNPKLKNHLSSAWVSSIHIENLNLVAWALTTTTIVYKNVHSFGEEINSIYKYINPKPLNPIYTPNNKAYRVEDHLSWWLQPASPFLLHLLAQLTTASSSVEYDTATNCYRLCREDEEEDNNSHQPCSSSLMILYSTPPGRSYDHREDEMEDFAGLQAEWFYYIWTQQPWSP